jgi:hypothetical protein
MCLCAAEVGENDGMDRGGGEDPDPAREHRVQRNDVNADVGETETGVNRRLVTRG